MGEQDRRQRRGRRGERGFTLVELLISVAIVGILSAIAVVNLQSALDRSRQRKTMATMRNLSTAVEAYNTDNNHLPANGLTADELSEVLKENVYNTVETRDGWNNDIVYSAASGHYTLESYGRDGADGPADVTVETRDQFDYDIVLQDGQFSASPETGS